MSASSSIASEFLDGGIKGLFVDNDFIPAASDDTLTATNPATGDRLGEASIAQQSDVDLAVAAPGLRSRTDLGPP